MPKALLIVHIICCLILTLLVLVQKTKGSIANSSFGGASQTFFGSHGSLGFLKVLTIIIASLFFLTSVSLTYFAAHPIKDTAQKIDAEILEKAKDISSREN